MGRVSGKVAIVTGGASGVGKDDAILLVKEGAKVVLTDLNEKDGNAVAAQIGENALFVKHDISSEDGWKEVIARTEEKFGGVDILVNNQRPAKELKLRRFPITPLQLGQE